MEVSFPNGVTEPMLKCGKYIDVRNNQGKWCVGIIKDTRIMHNVSLVGIHFEGWRTYIDDEIPTSSQKLAPFRKFTRGYTGEPNLSLITSQIN